MRLLIADDHTLFRETLAEYIQRAEPDAVVMPARDLHEVVEIMESRPQLDLILLDMRMPGMEGLQGLEKIRISYPDVQVALLSGLAEKHHVQQAMKLGAAGFFPKTMSGKAMLNGIHKILEGERYLATDHNTNEIMPSYYNGHTDDHGAVDGLDAGATVNGAEIGLTPREIEVLSYLLRGESNKEIARALGLQVVTVKLHVRGVCRKLNAKNRTQAALKAQQLGLISKE